MLPPDMPEAERRAAIDATLVKREGRPEHVAHAVVFLVENDFVTGVCLPVDGGRTVYAAGFGVSPRGGKFPNLPMRASDSDPASWETCRHVSLPVPIFFPAARDGGAAEIARDL